jgi:hypothetical protein
MLEARSDLDIVDEVLEQPLGLLLLRLPAPLALHLPPDKGQVTSGPAPSPCGMQSSSTVIRYVQSSL